MSANAKIAETASQLVQACMRSGLLWDEAVSALGLAAKGLAVLANANGDGSLADCVAHAEKRLKEATLQPVLISPTTGETTFSMH